MTKKSARAMSDMGDAKMIDIDEESVVARVKADKLNGNQYIDLEDLIRHTIKVVRELAVERI